MIPASALFFAALVALGAEPSAHFEKGGIVQLGGETLLGPVAYGDSEHFWETHALVIGMVEEARLEYDPEKLLTREHLGIRVRKSIPERFAYQHRLLTKVVERPVVAYDRPANPPPPQFRAGDELMLMVSLGQSEFGSYAMMPGGQELCLAKNGKSSRIGETLRLCKALATADLPKRLALIGALLHESPEERVKLVLRRRLESTLGELQMRVQETQLLLQRVNAGREEPAAKEQPAAKEESMSGIVTATSGRVVVLQEDAFFSVNKDTCYFRETGRDPAETTAEILKPGTAVMAVGNKDIDGEFVAARVYALLGNVLRGVSGGGPRSVPFSPRPLD